MGRCFSLSLKADKISRLIVTKHSFREADCIFPVSSGNRECKIIKKNPVNPVYFKNQNRIQSVSETVRDGLRLLEEREIKLNALRRALKEGEASGFADYSLSGLIKELDNKGTK